MSARTWPASSGRSARAAADTSARPPPARPATASPARAAPRTGRRTRPGRRHRRGGTNASSARRGIGGHRELGEQARRAGRADARHQLQRAQAGALAARIGGEAEHGEHVLDVRGVEKLEAAVLDERNVAPRQLELERVAVLGAAKEHRLVRSARPDSRSARMRSATHEASAASSSTHTSAGRSPPAFARSVLTCRSAASAITALQAARMGAVERWFCSSASTRAGGVKAAAKSRMLRTSAARNE